MSTTERYGTDVWRGFLKASAAANERGEKWIGVGEVCHHAGVAKATARKYLRMLDASGDIEIAETSEIMLVRVYPIGE